ncbi:MAG: capsid protein [Lachnospiraceae bacterium]
MQLIDIKEWIRTIVAKLYDIVPRRTNGVKIQEHVSLYENIMKNKILYRGDPCEIEQFFKSTASCDAFKSRFWAASPYRSVRKIHSGIVSIVIDRYKGMLLSDIQDIDFGESEKSETLKQLWEEIAKNTEWDSVLEEAIISSLSCGDGAFKICLLENSNYPTIEFYDAENVFFNYKYGKLYEILFYTEFPYPNSKTKKYHLEETYGRGYITYRLLDDAGKEVEMSTLPELVQYEAQSYNGDFIMGAPLMFFKSKKWRGRGKALFDDKTDVIDGLDETISQWLDAIRKGRVNRYIPEDMIPRNEETGEIVKPNDFDNDYIALGTSRKEGASDKIEVVQPAIAYEAYLSSYTTFMDLVLQGIMSPSTLGIDLKKTDNAESQREKEKITLEVRSSLADTLTKVIPDIISKIMMVYDLMRGPSHGEYEISISFGEYASPSFDTVVETVGKAKNYGVMSIEKAVEELYGDTLTEEEKQEEIKRIKEQQGIVEMEEPQVRTEIDGFKADVEVDKDEGEGSE